MTDHVAKPKPHKPLDPYTLRWVARYLRQEAIQAEDPKRVSCLNVIASWYRVDADELDKMARRAARKRQ